MHGLEERMFKPTTRRSRRPRLRARVLAAVVVVFAVAPMAATAGVYAVSGDQVAIDESSSTMTGGLKGTWTSFVADYRFDEATGRIVAWGTETFAGCLDRRLNGCDASDVQGTLSFSSSPGRSWIHKTGTPSLRRMHPSGHRWNWRVERRPWCDHDEGHAAGRWQRLHDVPRASDNPVAWCVDDLDEQGGSRSLQSAKDLFSR